MPLALQDAELLRRGLRDDLSAIYHLFEIHGGTIYNVALGVLGVPEEAQKLTLAVAKELASGDGNYNYRRAVLPQILRRTVIHLRRELTGNENSAPAPPAEGPDAEIWRTVGPVAGRRPAEERIQFYAWVSTGLLAETAAEIVGRPAGTYWMLVTEILSDAGIEPLVETSSGPIQPQGAPPFLLDALHRALFLEEEEEESAVTSGSHHRRLRRRIFRNRSIKLPEGYFPIILALLVLITVSWILIRLPMLQGPNEIETTRSPASPGP